MLSTPVTISNRIPPTSINTEARSSSCAGERAADQANRGEGQADLAGQRRGAVHTDRGPAEPRPHLAGRLQPHPAGAHPDGFGVELGHATPAAAQQFGGPPQNPARVAAETDVAV